MVSCDVAAGIILGTKLKMSIFTLYLPHNFQSLCVSKVYVIRIQFQIKLAKTSVRKDWSDQEVMTQIDKDFSP